MRREDGTVQPYEEVVKELNGDLVDYSADIGLSAFRRYAEISLKVHSEDYASGVEWLRRLMRSVEWSAERVVVEAQKLVSNAADKKRNGNRVASHLHSHLLFQPGTNPSLSSVLRQEPFLAQMAKQPHIVVERLRELSSQLAGPSTRLAVHFACDPAKLDSGEGVHPAQALAQHRPEGGERLIPGQTPEPLFYRQPATRRSGIISVAACEAGHVIRSVKSMPGVKDEDLPAVLVFLQYLSQCEGPLWCEVRGKSLAYGANIYGVPESGLISLSLYRSTDPAKVNSAEEGLNAVLENLCELMISPNLSLPVESRRY